jgi:hypothetical protein
LYIGDTFNNRLREVSGGIITTVSANWSNGEGYQAVTLSYPQNLATDSFGNLFFNAGATGTVWRIAAGAISPAAAGGSGDSAVTSLGMFSQPGPMARDQAGDVYVVDGYVRVRMMSASGSLSTVAGTGVSGYSGDNGPATAAQQGNPVGLAVDSSGALYIADLENHRVRRVYQGIITTVADGPERLHLLGRRRVRWGRFDYDHHERPSVDDRRLRSSRFHLRR